MYVWFQNSWQNTSFLSYAPIKKYFKTFFYSSNRVIFKQLIVFPLLLNAHRGKKKPLKPKTNKISSKSQKYND